MANNFDLPTEESRTILSFAKQCPASEWRMVCSGQIERWEYAVGVVVNDLGFRSPLSMELCCMRTLRPARESYQFGLFKREYGAQRRVYMLESSNVPLGRPGDHSWPHEHVGHPDRLPFPPEEVPTSFDSALSHFMRKCNVQPEEPIGDPLVFVLRSQR